MSTEAPTVAGSLPGDGGIAAVERGGQHYLFERYKASDGVSALLRGYYALRPLIPRPVQIAMRRRYARHQSRLGFPAWPIEPVLVDCQHDDLRSRMGAFTDGRVPLVNFWPERRRFAFVLTHDVESAQGVANIGRVREIEERHGMVSSWNFCAEQYPIPDGVFDRLREEGCEIGLHAIDHRGKLFSSRARFEAQLPAIRQYLEDWDAAGFRSPALHRNADWMPELGCDYDSSFPDTDPFEPQAGGCCWVFPFFNGEMIELPVTLVQDHTHWEILRRPNIDLWVEKIGWLREVHGLVNVIVHPDYLLRDDRLELYDQLLVHLRSLENGWHALPRDVASWWRHRATLGLETTSGGAVRVVGDPAGRATVAYAREQDGAVVFDL